MTQWLDTANIWGSGFQELRSLFRHKIRRLDFSGPTNTAVGSGTISDNKGHFIVLRTGATADSSILTRTYNCGLNPATGRFGDTDWREPLSLFFNIELPTSDAQAVRRIQLKEATTIGVLGELGIGLQIDNLALTGEAYGTSRGTVDLATTLTIALMYHMEIRLTASGVEFFVDGASKGSITTAGKFPAALGTVETNFVLSHANGAAGTNTDMRVMDGWLIQEAA